MTEKEKLLELNEKLLMQIEKLQKENERKDCKILNLAEENTRLHEEINKRVKLKIENEKIVDEEFIPKYKIREKLERLENQKENYKEQPLIYMLLKNQLKSLIEEE